MRTRELGSGHPWLLFCRASPVLTLPSFPLGGRLSSLSWPLGWGFHTLRLQGCPDLSSQMTALPRHRKSLVQELSCDPRPPPPKCTSEVQSEVSAGPWSMRSSVSLKITKLLGCGLDLVVAICLWEGKGDTAGRVKGHRSWEPFEGPDLSLPEVASAPELSNCMCQDTRGVFSCLHSGWVRFCPFQLESLSTAAVT